MIYRTQNQGLDRITDFHKLYVPNFNATSTVPKYNSGSINSKFLHYSHSSLYHGKNSNKIKAKPISKLLYTSSKVKLNPLGEYKQLSKYKSTHVNRNRLICETSNRLVLPRSNRLVLSRSTQKQHNPNTNERGRNRDMNCNFQTPRLHKHIIQNSSTIALS